MNAAAPRLRVTRYPGTLSYAEGYARQLEAVERLRDPANRVAELLVLEHAPVYTLGRMTQPSHLPLDEPALRASGAEVVRIDRGGSVTYHGPGQLTAYLLLHLKAWNLTIHQHLWNLEEIALRTLRHFELDGRRVDGMTGVWAGEAKVCAVGVGCRKWIAYHGLSLNVNLDLAPFARIDPCGLGRRPVTTLAALCGRPVALDEAAAALEASTRRVLS
ncbi:MAG: lipoyl(octanoyl) transferase LipB [Planctomycetes bacterium]|nr:lipoyl(octanoyl) transferase LipB [Planctomycetota bacterium]